MPLTSTERSRKRRARMTPAERTEYWSRYAQKRRVDLVKALSPDGKCHKCEKVFPHEQLTVDHLDGITWDHSEYNMRQRVSRYWKEYKAGVRLGAACGDCNSTDGGYRRWT